MNFSERLRQPTCSLTELPVICTSRLTWEGQTWASPETCTRRNSDRTERSWSEIQCLCSRFRTREECRYSSALSRQHTAEVEEGSQTLSKLGRRNTRTQPKCDGDAHRCDGVARQIDEERREVCHCVEANYSMEMAAARCDGQKSRIGCLLRRCVSLVQHETRRARLSWCQVGGRARAMTIYAQWQARRQRDNGSL